MKKVRFTSSFWWVILVLMVWGRYPILGYVEAVFSKLPGLDMLTSFIIPILFVVVILASRGYWGGKLRSSDFFVFSILELVAILNMLFFPENMPYYEKVVIGLIFIAIPCYLVGTSLKIVELEKYFYWVSIGSVLLQSAYLLLYGGRSELGDSDIYFEDMSLSYQLLPHVLMVTWQTLKQPKYWNIALSLLGIFLHLSLGTRGPIVCIAAFIVLYLFFVKLKTSKITGIIVALISVLAINFLQPITFFLNMLIMRAGLSTRIFDYMQNETLSDQTGRDDIRDFLLRAVDAGPAFGYGLAGDRRIVGTYAHNIFVELVVSFGWVIGILLLVFVFIAVIKAFYKAHNESEKGFLVLLFCLGVVKLMVSGSILDENFFYLLLGFCSYIGHAKYIATKSNT